MPTTDSTYDDREYAELRARQYESMGSHDGVRVIEEVWVERKQKYISRTVYRDSKVQQTVQAKIDKSRPPPAQTANARQSPKTNRMPGHERTPTANKKKTLNAYHLFAIFTLIVGVGIGTMIALEYYLTLL